MDTKTCANCSRTLSTDSFYRNRVKADGYEPTCKTCRSEYERLRRQKNQAEPQDRTQTKACRDCSEVKPLTDFYRQAAMADRHSAECKVCRSAYERRRRQDNLEALREYDRRRFRESPARRANHAAYCAKAERAQPHKRAAYSAVAHAIKSGRLTRQPCESCGNPKSEAHHHDYHKPLDVRWLCKLCHEAVHHASGGM